LPIAATSNFATAGLSLGTHGSILNRVLEGLVPDKPHHIKLLERAARPGRTQDVASTIITACLEKPGSTQSILRDRIREASFLHSNERRLIGDGVADIFRIEKFLSYLLKNEVTDRAQKYWAAWLVIQGLPIEQASEKLDERARRLLMTPKLVGSFKDPSTELSFASSIPMEAAGQLVAHYGAQQAAEFVLASNQRAPVVIRVNAARFNRDDVHAQLNRLGIICRRSSYADDGIIIEKRANLRGTLLFRQGAFEFQDEGSQLVARAIPLTARRVIDYCAGAGGKTLQIATLLPKTSTVMACDIRQSALSELRRRAQRNRLRRIETHLITETKSPPPVGRADCVLVDAPCSGSGTLRRQAHNRHRMTRLALAETKQTQEQILNNASQLVKPHGHLIYATCSVLPSENEEQVQAFLTEHPNFALIGIDQWLDNQYARVLGNGDYLRTAPHTQRTDGFFTALLQRRP
jgi:16S rRNA (cytosine967-C5)-methyltransferase